MRLIVAALGLAAFGYAQPHLLLRSEDFERVNALASTRKWAADARDAIVGAARDWPQSYLSRYGLKQLALPPEGGQWTLWYVCPVHGVNLQYTAPNTHTCPVDKKLWTGWPYDQVIYARRHSDLTNAARDNALAFRLTGERSYAEAAAWILRQYAARYSGYALKDVNNKVTSSGARAMAQTLDEAVWLIPLVWAYDLLSGTDALSGDDRAAIEQNLLRAAVAVIQRNDAGASNWQSWHNAAIGAAGFALQDAGLMIAAVDGKSGFRFQMKNSVIGEGFWYEGAWGYHFYALDPLVQLAEMAAQSGVDLWQEPGMRGMFAAPLELTFADGSLPAFNDSKSQSLFDQARLYEHAYARYGDPRFAAVAGRRTRSRDALLWGAAEIPDATPETPRSAVFPDSGYAVLRAPQGDHAVTMKFGPHGDWHGHYDKLGFVSYALGGILGVDPGTQSYAAPTHATWDKETVAHNTVVLDETSQAPATGRLLWQEVAGQYSAASADAGPAYPNTALQRTMFVTPEYALDLVNVAATDGAEHRIDWVYHNAGSLTVPLDLSPYAGFGKSNGYQNLTANRAAVTDGDWQATFDGFPRAPVTFSSVYASTTGVSGTFEYSSEQAASGRFAGKMSYRFSGDGYLLFSVPVTTPLPQAVPSGLRLMVFGDGSRHKLTLRINDASDERFTLLIGPVDWQGWKQVEALDPAKWSHYLGNNDGVIDLPIRSVTLEFGRVSGGPDSGVLYADDIALVYPDGSAVTTAGFELPVRNLKVWMLGDPGTTVVTGNGLGPDLLTPVPYLMARRTGKSTAFAALLEPFADSPRVTSVTRPDTGMFTIRTADFEDHVRLGDAGVTHYERVAVPASQ